MQISVANVKQEVTEYSPQATSRIKTEDNRYASMPGMRCMRKQENFPDANMPKRKPHGASSDDCCRSILYFRST